MKIYHSIQEMVGQTPILQLHHIEKQEQTQAHLFAKLEYYNPAGSVKDRVARGMLLDALESGKLQPGATIIEPTSGNTGIGLCAIGVALGFEVIIVMPDTMSEERRKLMKAFGAKLVLTPGQEGMTGAINKAKALAKDISQSFIPSQFTNPSNPKAHYLSTGPEMNEQMDGKVDIFVAGVGTGGTISGVGQYLKEKNPQVQIIAVEPKDSPLLSNGQTGPHQLQGIGANFVPETLDTHIYDQIITVSTDEAFEAARQLAQKEGILTGISSGAALYAAKTLAKQPENKDKNIVVLLPDGGDRYLSTALYE